MASETRGAGKVVWETIVLLVVAVVLALVVKTFFLQAFYIPSGSMEPGLTINDRILVQKPSYWLGGEPQRGDVVVFDDPGGWLSETEDVGPEGMVPSLLAKIGLYPTGGHLVKRVIGVAGDTIVCCDAEGRLSVNGVPLEEGDFIAPQQECDGPMADCRGWETTVPEGNLFVMGDNRGESADSSFHLCRPRDTECDPSDAFVPVDLVVGKVFALVWPLGHAKFLHRPDAFEAVPDAG